MLTEIEAWVDQLMVDHRATYEGTLPDNAFLAIGLAGEVGEALNFIKKEGRDSVDNTHDVRKELADSFVYLIMLSRVYGMTFEDLYDIAQMKHQEFMKKKEAMNVARYSAGQSPHASTDQ